MNELAIAANLDNKLIVCEVGSTLHGIGIGSDDRDYMGVCVEPESAVFGLGRFEQYEYRTAPKGTRSGPNDVDVVIYGLRKWMRLAVKGNPSVIVLLYATDPFVEHISELGAQLVGMRNAIVSQECRGRFLGYLHGQRLRAEEERGSGRGRREGRTAKWASHMVRLGFQAEELLATGHLTLPMPPDQAAICRAVKRGHITFERALGIAQEQEQKINGIRSVLREKPDIDAIELWMRHAYLSTFGKDKAL